MKPRPDLLASATCLVGLGLAVAVVCLLVPVGTARPGPPAGAPGSGTRAPTTGVAMTVQALGVLAGWDRRRRAAWAAGDVEQLRRLYLPGSRTGRRDVRMLRAYVDRGFRVTGVRMQVRRARLVRASPRRAVVAVSERLTGAVARRGGWAHALPRDHYSRHLVRLRRAGGEWRVVEVTDQVSAAATTAATSSSANP